MDFADDRSEPAQTAPPEPPSTKARGFRQRRLLHGVALVIGALASLIAVIQFAQAHVAAALVLAALAALVLFRRELARLARRCWREALLLLLGIAIGAVAGASFAWNAWVLPHRAAPEVAPSPKMEAPAPLPHLDTPTPMPYPGESSETVYRTPAGEKYHRATCRYVKGKAISLSLAEAKERGLTPCKVCRPPTLP